jgi:hypothetical protein
MIYWNLLRLLRSKVSFYSIEHFQLTAAACRIISFIVGTWGVLLDEVLEFCEFNISNAAGMKSLCSSSSGLNALVPSPSLPAIFELSTQIYTFGPAGERPMQVRKLY